MRRRKRITALCLAILVVMQLVACGKSDGNSDSVSNDNVSRMNVTYTAEYLTLEDVNQMDVVCGTDMGIYYGINSDNGETSSEMPHVFFWMHPPKR